jgi:hypothetical protein
MIRIEISQPPLTLEERRRRAVRLCCRFIRNLAFFRAGLQPEVPPTLFALTHPQCAFWREAHGRFFDACVLEWCKLFADYNGEHHWRRVVAEPKRFKADLCTKLGVTTAEFDDLIAEVKSYRDKFVAHLDEERTMRFPMLEQPMKAVEFLFERLAREAHSLEDWQRGGLPTTAEQWDSVFTRAFREAQSVYAEAIDRRL